MGPAAGAISVISGVYGIYSGMQQSKEAGKAASEQEKRTRQQAALTEDQYREQASRDRKTADIALAENRARAAASGTEANGSMDIFNSAEKDRFNQEIDWLLKAGKSNVALGIDSGYAAADVTRSQGKAALGNALAGGFKQIGGGVDDLNTRYNWW